MVLLSYDYKNWTCVSGANPVTYCKRTFIQIKVILLTFVKLATISCTSDFMGAMYITLNSSRLTELSEFKCFPTSLKIHSNATLVLPAP